MTSTLVLPALLTRVYAGYAFWDISVFLVELNLLNIFLVLRVHELFYIECCKLCDVVHYHHELYVGASMGWHLLLPLLNSFNTTKAAIFQVTVESLFKVKYASLTLYVTAI